MVECDEYICTSFSYEHLNDNEKLTKYAANQSSRGANKPSKELGPLNLEELGNSTWPILHRMSLSYPDKPSREEKRRMSSLMNGFAMSFPCKNCSRDF